MNNRFMQRKQSEALKKASKKELKYIKKNRFKFLKIYNLLCEDCRVKVIANPMRPYSDYCEDCQTRIKEVLGEDAITY